MLLRRVPHTSSLSHKELLLSGREGRGFSWSRNLDLSLGVCQTLGREGSWLSPLWPLLHTYAAFLSCYLVGQYLASCSLQCPGDPVSWTGAGGGESHYSLGDQSMVGQVQADQYIPEEDIYGEMDTIERQLDALEHRGVLLEEKLRGGANGAEAAERRWLRAVG